MKFLKIYLILTLVIVLLIPSCAFGKKRDLSTPLSRLIGHWQDRCGFEYYFVPVDRSTMIGSFVRVFPDKEKIMKFTKETVEYNALERLKKGDFKSKKEAKEWAETILEKYEEERITTMMEKIAGTATYCQYKVLFQISEGEGIEIAIMWPEDEPTRIPKEEAIFYIEKNGKRMTMEATWRELVHPTQYGKFISPIKYIDSKTSPEDK